MIKIKNDKKSIIKLIFIYILLIRISCEPSECERENPIKNGTQCLSIYCSESQFESGECIKANNIIKTQWLNNIILVGERDFRYINFGTSKNGTIFLYTTPNPFSRKRIIFGINSNGKPVFKDSNNNNINIYQKNISGNNFNQTESISGIIKIDGDNKEREYFILIGKNEYSTEIFALDDYKNEIKIISYKDIVKYFTEIFFGNIIHLIENNKHYYIIGLIINNYNTYQFYLSKFNLYFDSNRSNIYCNITQTSENFTTVDSKISNCYLSNTSIIICIYISNNSYFEIFFDTNLKSQKEIDLLVEYNSNYPFFKFFHFKDDLDILFHYQSINYTNYSTIQIIENKIIESNISTNINKTIILNKYVFHFNLMLTDIIKIRDNLICLISTKISKEELIIVLINFYNGIEYNVRYYLIDMFKLYNHKFLSEMKLHLYNNNIAFGFSFCRNLKCDGDEDEHYSSIIFFSYPNSTDFNLDIISYLNKMDNNNIIINLFDFVNIDNNIFGFIIDGIKIYSIDNCGINYVSNKTNKEINENYYLLKEENLQLNFSKNKYQIQTCSIIFIPIITEPDFNEYNKYPNFILKNQMKMNRRILQKLYMRENMGISVFQLIKNYKQIVKKKIIIVIYVYKEIKAIVLYVNINIILLII